jgi:hypothetical protein
MGQHRNKRQVMVYLSETAYKRLKLRAARAGVSMSVLVEQALDDGPTSDRPMRPLSRVAEPPLPPAAAALVAHGAPLLGHGDSDLPLEEALALGVRESRRHPALLRALVVAMVKNKDVSWAIVREHLAPEEWPTLGAVVDLAAVASRDEGFRRYADELFSEVGATLPTESFFTEPAIAKYSLALAERTPASLRKWGFLCATPVEDFEEAVRRFCDRPS